MPRRIRRVPANWEHPVDENGDEIPLHENFAAEVALWDDRAAKWSQGLRPLHNVDAPPTYQWIPLADYLTHPKTLREDYPMTDYFGHRPRAEDYVPDWPAAERTHYQLYDECTEGLPISNPEPSLEALATWCSENVPLWGGKLGTYNEWLDAMHTCVDWQPRPLPSGQQVQQPPDHYALDCGKHKLAQYGMSSGQPGTT